MEISYKIPKSSMFILLGIGIFYPLGTFGFLDDSFNQSPGSKLISVVAYLSVLIYFYITPRNRKIVADEEGISVPKILFPPYKEKYFKWSEIIEFREKTSFGNHAHKSIILRTNNDKFEIKNILCFSDYEFSRTPKAYDQLYDYIILRVSSQAKGKYLLL